MKHIWGSIVVCVSLLCCDSKNKTQTVPNGNSPESASSTAGLRRRGSTDPVTATTHRLVGEGEKRVALLVLPGDALVEIDNVPAQRRNGMVELVGKPGDAHQIEVFLDAATKIEKTVKIESAGVSPALIDAEKEAKIGSGPAKTPIVFDINE